MIIIGPKKANSKSRKFDQNVSLVVFDDRFQISTVMDIDASGKPLKAKMVRYKFFILNSLLFK
jgi:hypothetical protein